jgi:hypothetical protein
MRLVKLTDLFDVAYGSKLDANKTTSIQDGINLVTRSRKHLGISGRVMKVEGLEPLEAGLITVSLGGSYLLSAFVQPEKFYTAQNIKVLRPKMPMTFNEKLFYCLCIKSNRFKYSSHGREANRSLDGLMIPHRSEIHKWVNDASFLKSAVRDGHTYPMNSSEHSAGLVRIKELFDVVNGVFTSDIKKYSKDDEGDLISLIRPSKTQFTSTVEFIRKSDVDEKYIFPAHTLYVSTDGQGSHTYAYVSTAEFVPNSNVSVLLPKKVLTLQEKLFYAHVISLNRWLFSYGRKPKGERLKLINIPERPPSFVYGQNLFKKALNFPTAFS